MLVNEANHIAQQEDADDFDEDETREERFDDGEEEDTDAYDIEERNEYRWDDEVETPQYLSQYVECSSCSTLSSTRCMICDRCHCRVHGFDYSRLVCGDCLILTILQRIIL